MKPAGSNHRLQLGMSFDRLISVQILRNRIESIRNVTKKKKKTGLIQQEVFSSKFLNKTYLIILILIILVNIFLQVSNWLNLLL